MSFNPSKIVSIMSRHINLARISNFRDLGGYECRYGETSFGVLYRSARIDLASVADKQKLTQLGIKTIIDLRDDKQKSEHPDFSLPVEGFKNISLPVNGNGRIPVDHEDQIDSYLEMLEEPYSARKVFKAILNEDKPLLFHCSAGKDRTGCFTMVLLLLAGVSMDDINADYLASFAYLREQAHECKGKLPDVVITPNIDFIFEVVDRFNERYGNVNGYLEAIGLSDDEIAGLASILGKQEKSCGAVLFKDGKVLVEHMRLGHYSIPKGHVEKSDKDEFDTALREIREEVGLEAKIIPGFRQTIYYSPRDGVIKQVVFFAAEANEGDMRLQEEEVADAYWISPADAMRVLSHDSDRLVVRNAAYFQAGDSVKKVED